MKRIRFWNSYLSCYDTLNSFNDYQNYMDDLAKAVGGNEGRKILDAGSGTGNLSIHMKKNGADVLSLDFSTTGLKKHIQKDHEANQLQASLEEKLPLESNTYDGIVCASVLFALSPKGMKNALAEFHRILKPDGVLVITSGIPNISKSKMAFKHYWSSLCSRGPVALFREVCSNLLPTIKILYYNYCMYVPHKSESLCKRFSKDDLLNVIQQGGFSLVQYDTTMGGKLHLFLTKPIMSNVTL